MQNVLKTQQLEIAFQRFSPRTAFSFSFMWNNPPLGWKIEILTVANHCLLHPLPFPRLLQDSKPTKQDAEHKQHGQTSRIYNEETRQSKALTDGEIYNIFTNPDVNTEPLSKARGGGLYS